MKIIESDFEYRNYRCVTTFTDMGIRCGYVAIPKEHPLYGKFTYSDVKVPFKDIANGKLGKRSVLTLLGLPEDEDLPVTLCTYFDVHGGITFADCGHPISDDNWYIGFDCGHYRDGKDLDFVLKTWIDDEDIKKRVQFEREIGFSDNYEVRTLEYVQQECRNLVDQIIELIDKYYNEKEK